MHNVVFIVIFLYICNHATAQDWPDWRGPDRKSIWDAELKSKEFPVPELVWSQSIGSGYSGPIVAEGRVYITDLRDNPFTEGIVCFDEKTGQKLWEFRYPCKYEREGYPAGPRASVVYDENKIWSLGTMGHLMCADAVSGEIKWQKNLSSDYSIVMPI